MTINTAGDQAFTRRRLKGSHREFAAAGATSFLRRRYTKDLSGVDVAVTGVPFDIATTNRPGARLGPRAIRQESTIISSSGPYGWERNPSEVLAIADYGDCVFDFGSPKQIPARIEAHFAEILEAGAASLALGGDHFITYPILRAYARRYGPMALVQFDAHTDTWEDEGERIDHGTMFLRALRDGVARPDRSIQVGIRTVNPNTRGIRILDAPWVHDHSPRDVSAAILETVGDSPVYVTFDIDCLDPAYAPGTGTPEPGGLSSGQAMAILRGLKGINVKGADVVEVSPPYDASGITALAGATMGHCLLALMAAARTG